MSDTLRRLQQRYGEALDSMLFRRLNGSDDPTFLGMMRYQFGYVDEGLRPSPASSGKRFRPLMCLLACECVGGVWHDALTAAAAIELLHNFSLIHDDIEDHDASRRHRPTVWKVWGESQAINVGDAVFAEAFRAILDSHPDSQICVALAREFGDVVLKLTEGQYMDMSFELRTDVTPDEYLAMIERKSAQIIAFSLWAGAGIGGATRETRTHLHEYGITIGKAFQIHDDIMGIWGATEVTGKETGTDLTNRKKTLPLLIAASKGTTSQRGELLRFLQRECDDVDVVREVLHDTQAYELSQAEIRSLMRRADRALSLAGLAGESIRELQAIAGEITGQAAASN